MTKQLSLLLALLLAAPLILLSIAPQGLAQPPAPDSQPDTQQAEPQSEPQPEPPPEQPEPPATVAEQSPAPSPVLPPPQPQEVPQPLDRVHFYLITVAPGDDIWNNFGHTALRVYDENAGSDLVYNWGMFDSGGSITTFAWRFFQGGMDYWLGVNSPAAEFALYREQQRSVWQERLNLTPAQKEQLLDRLSWNLQPENVAYPYHHFHDNCTTRPRDYLDEALGGSLAGRFADTTDSTYRDEVRQHYASNPLVGFSLDVILNSDLDRQMTEWQAMFLPLRLRDGLLQTPSDVLAEDGSPLPLLSDSEVIMRFPPTQPGLQPHGLASLLLLGLTLYLLLLLRRTPASWSARAGLGLRAPRLNYRLLGLMALCTSLFGGIYGSLMLGGWFVSSHQDLYHNINLLLFWPTDLAGIVPALYWLFKCRPWPMSADARPFITNYLLAHGLGVLLYLGLALFGGVAQEIGLLALYVAPGYLLYILLLRTVGFVSARPANLYL